MNCVFCRIIAGELPCCKVYEDENFLAFLDIHPIRSGHTLVVPKAHTPNFLETPTATLAAAQKVLQKIAGAISAALACEGLNISVNNGRAAGQVIDHLHWHIIPRVSKDGLASWPNQDVVSDELAEIAIRVKKSL